MGIWSAIRGRLRGGPPAEDAPGWRVLRHLGVSGNFLFWAQRESKDLAGTWAACPRADWLVSLAARAGVDRRAVGEAVSDCVDQLPEADDHRTAVLTAADRWVERLCKTKELCRPLTFAINHSLDRDPELRRARMARHVAVGRQFPEERLNADLAERTTLQRTAERVRRRISFDDLRKAIWGDEPRDAPYR